MHSIVVSLNENILKVSVNSAEGFTSTTTTLDASVAQDSRITNAESFARALESEIQKISLSKGKKLPLHFLVEPEDVFLHFTTINKQIENVHEYIIAEARTKMADTQIEDTYFSYKKIAPFVYQFVAVKKTDLESYIEVANIAGMELASVVPWVLLLPRVITDNDPSIFVANRNGNQVVALSDLNGIYFSGVYANEKSTEEIQSIVQELSVYKRANPIKRIYTVDYENFNLTDGYQVISLPVPINDITQNESYKIHILYNMVVEGDMAILENQTNLLNLLPLPAVKKSKVPMYVGAAVAALFIVAGVAYFGFINPVFNSSEDAEENIPNSEVLSETNENTPAETPESTSSEDQTQEPIQEVELNREDLVIRIENGAGIPGIAGSTQTTLEELGYTVESIGNAEGDLRENTLVQFKESAAQYRNLLLDDIKDDYEVVYEDGLSEDLPYDVLLVLGQN